MTYRVIQWGTGSTGKGAVQGIVAHPELELVGCWVHAEAKDGLDVGDICDVGPIGIAATRDKQALLAMDADCVSFMPARTWTRDPKETFADLLAILRSGKNVANLWWPMLVNPKAVGGEAVEQIEAACRDGGSTFYTGGMNPGFGTFGLMMMGLKLSSSVDVIRGKEFFNNAYWTDDMADFFGFGQSDPATVHMLQPGVMTGYYEAPLRLMAEAIGAEIEAFVEANEVVYAAERFETPVGVIEKGTISGLVFKVRGMVGGKVRVEMASVTRMRDEDFPEEGFARNGYRLDIEGEPTLRIDMAMSSPPGFEVDDKGVGVNLAAAMTAVNVIPDLCEAAPGIVTSLDLAGKLRRF